MGYSFGCEFIDYRTLGERKLGSIYEGHLEYRPRLAEEAIVAVRDGKDEGCPPPKRARDFRHQIGRS